MATPLVVDTDPGVDDAFALAVAAGSPEVELTAVTTVFGNVDVDTATGNAGRVLALLERPDVPVGRGAGRPLIHPLAHRAEDVHGEDGLGGRAVDFPPPAAPVGRAHDVLVRALERADEPVVLAAIGPLTNVALLTATRPDLVERIDRLVIMGGSVGIGGNVSAAAEFNVWNDPEAARRALVEEVVPTTLVPVDLTHAAAVDEPWLDALATSGPVGRVLAGTRTPYLRHYRATLGVPKVALHDAVAVLEAAVPGSLRTSPLPVEVDTSLGPARGAVIADRRGAGPGRGATRPVDVALDADLDALRSALAARLAGS